MPARKSIIIGCGTTGSEIAAKVYLNFKEYIKMTGENEDAIQFFLIDTADPIKGAEELHHNGDHLMIGVKNGNAVRAANWENDPFFRQWWPKEYQNIPGLYPGAGTVPINGRLAFWTRLGNPNLNESFEKKFQNSVVKVGAAGDIPVMIVQVFIICTLSGGTGAGIFLDVAHLIKERINCELKINGVFLLDDIVNIRASSDVHNMTSANAYGALIGLNYWQTPSNLRDIDLGHLMKKFGVTIKGDTVPFNVCYLLSRLNANGLGMESIDDYMHMASDAISMMLFEERAGTIDQRQMDNTNNISVPLTLGKNPTPRMFGSFAAYTLSYHPEKAVDYLTSDLTIRTLDAFQAVPNNITDLVEERADNYLCLNHLREVDDDGTGAMMNEVTDQIKTLENPDMILYPVMKTILQHLNRTDTATALINEMTKDSTTAGNYKQVFMRFKDNVTAGLTGSLENQSGVNYHQLMEANRRRLYEHAIKRMVEPDPAQPMQISGLHQLLGWMIADKVGHIASAKRLLELIQHEIPKHRESLEFELDGSLARGIEGDRNRLTRLETNLDSSLAGLGNTLFKGGTRKRKQAVKFFEEKWWKPWLKTKIDVMAKDQAVAFYTGLELEIEWLLEFINKDLVEVFDNLKKDNDTNKAKIYSQATSKNTDRLEEETILDGKGLVIAYEKKLKDSVKANVESFSTQVVNEIEDLFSKKDRTLSERRNFKKKLEDSLTALMKSEGEILFTDDLRKLSLWDSMILGLSDPTPDRIKNYVLARINRIENRCVPYWQIDPAFASYGYVPLSYPIHSYDPQAKTHFESAHGIELDIRGAATEVADTSEILNDVEKSDFPAGYYNFKLLVVESGVPLHFISPANTAMDVFNFRRKTEIRPCIADKRYERLINRGLPTWGINTEGNEETIYYLLMAEHFGILESPLLSATKSTHGNYRYGIVALKSIRYRAFEQLLPGGEYWTSLYPEIKNMVLSKQKEFNENDWLKEHLICYQRLTAYLKENPKNSAWKEVEKHRDLLGVYLRRNYDVDQELKEIEVNGILP